MTREQMTIRLPLDLKEQIQKQADLMGITLHDLILFILWEDNLHTFPK